MKTIHTLFLAAALMTLGSCGSTPGKTEARTSAPISANPKHYVCEPLGQREAAMLRNAIARCDSVQLNREWFPTIGSDEHKWECRMYRGEGEKLESILARLSAESRWYVECAKHMMHISFAYVSRIRFLDEKGKVLYDTDKMPTPCCADENGLACDLCEFFPFPAPHNIR